MSLPIECTIPGNIALQVNGYSKLMTLIYVYGPERIANILEVAGLSIKNASGIDFELQFDGAQAINNQLFPDESQAPHIENFEELEQGNCLENLSEAFRELSVTPIAILEEE